MRIKGVLGALAVLTFVAALAVSIVAFRTHTAPDRNLVWQPSPAASVRP